jgi:hypothetical protein
MSPPAHVNLVDVIVHRYNCPISTNAWPVTQIDNLIIISVKNVITYLVPASIYKGICDIIYYISISFNSYEPTL